MKIKPCHACLAVFTVILIILCASVASHAKTAKKITKTRIIKYVPEIPSAKREGSCWTGSNIIRRPDVWRCMIGNEIFDPCYTAHDRTTIICGARPDIKEPSGFVLKLDRPLPEDGAADDLSTAASMVELEDGTICDYIAGATGAWDGVRSERINYSCRIKGQRSVIFGGLQRGEVWIAEQGVLVEQKTRAELPPWLVKDLKKVKIKTVWQ